MKKIRVILSVKSYLNENGLVLRILCPRTKCYLKQNPIYDIYCNNKCKTSIRLQNSIDSELGKTLY